MKHPSRQAVAGFTLAEMLVIIVIIGILAGIAAPGWVSFLTRQRLNAAQAEAVTAMRTAQVNAKKEKRSWEVAFRDLDNRVQWSVHPENQPQDQWQWRNLTGEDSELVEIVKDKTKLKEKDGVYTLRFEYNGWVKLDEPVGVDEEIGRIVFRRREKNSNDKSSKSCVYVSTILGNLRTDQNDQCVN